jgi:hypothetical protein
VNLVRDHVQQVMWQLLAQGVLVWGMDAGPNDSLSAVDQTSHPTVSEIGFMREASRWLAEQTS